MTSGKRTPPGSDAISPVRTREWWRSTLALIPVIGASILPLGACPACWPAYAGVLGSLGLGFMLNATYLLPLTLIFFSIALASLLYRAKRRRGYGPVLLGVVASGVALLGKFALSSDPLLYLGLALLIGASLWNAWPRTAATDSCAKCASQDIGARGPGAHD